MPKWISTASEIAQARLRCRSRNHQTAEAVFTASLHATIPGMESHAQIEFDREALDAFCRSHGIRRLSLFGSALGDGFRPDSDVDLLVEFEAGRVPGLIRLAGMELELSSIFGGREVELRTLEDLSRYFRDEVRASAAPLYVAA